MELTRMDDRGGSPDAQNGGQWADSGGGRFWARFRVRRGGPAGGGPPPKNGRNSAPDSGFLRNCADPRVKITPKNPFLSSPRRPAGAPRGSRGPPRRPAGTPRGPPRGPPADPPGPPPDSPISGPKPPTQSRTCSKNFLTKN